MGDIGQAAHFWNQVAQPEEFAEYFQSGTFSIILTLVTVSFSYFYCLFYLILFLLNFRLSIIYLVIFSDSNVMW